MPLVAAFIALSLNAILSFVGVRTLGVSGPAWANVAATWLSTGYTLWAIRQSVGVRWSSIFPFRSYLRTLAVAVVAALPAVAISSLDLPPWLTVLAGVGSYVGVYVYLCQASALMKTGDREFLRGVVRLHFLRPAARQGATS